MLGNFWLVEFKIKDSSGSVTTLFAKICKYEIKAIEAKKIGVAQNLQI